MKVWGGLTDLAKVKKLFVSPVTMFEEPASIKVNQNVLTEDVEHIHVISLCSALMDLSQLSH